MRPDGESEPTWHMSENAMMHITMYMNGDRHRICVNFQEGVGNLHICGHCS